jgi:hypothetical protein
VFVRDRQSGGTELACVTSAGAHANGDTRAPASSADGRFLAFESAATNLVANDTNGSHDVFLRDRDDGTTARVSVDTGGGQVVGDSFNPSVSADGRLVVFVSSSAQLVSGDTNGSDDVFLRDRIAATTQRVSVDSAGAPANGQSADAWISADGSRVAFMSIAGNLVPGDTNGTWDVFVRERQFAAMTSLCDPGTAAWPCPCRAA